MRTQLLCLVILMAIVGCGNESKKSHSIDTIKLQEGQSLHSFTKNLTLGPDTPENVGTLLALKDGMYGQNNIGLCTWFLIDKNMALTNSHCVPDTLKVNQELNCGDYLQGAIQTEDGVQKVRCLKLHFYSNISKTSVLGNDYALIELNKSVKSKNFYSLSREGFLEDEKIQILSMNHEEILPGNVYSTLLEHKCLIKSSDIFGRVTSPGSSPVIGFKEENSSDRCHVIGGNSGSPVLSSTGKLIAILHAGLKDGASFGSIQVDENLMTNDFSILTNFRCLKFNQQKLDSDIPAECKEELIKGKVSNTKMSKLAEEETLQKINKLAEDQPATLNYEARIEKKISQIEVSFDPKCIKSGSEWKKEDLDKIIVQGLFFKKNSFKSSLQSYELKYSLNLDYYGNFKIKTILNPKRKTSFELRDLQKLDEKGEAKIVIDSNERVLPLCKKEPI